jgi:hypothetical protein
LCLKFKNHQILSHYKIHVNFKFKDMHGFAQGSKIRNIFGNYEYIYNN